jgi:hypothetical protein
MTAQYLAEMQLRIRLEEQVLAMQQRIADLMMQQDSMLAQHHHHIQTLEAQLKLRDCHVSE